MKLKKRIITSSLALMLLLGVCARIYAVVDISAVDIDEYAAQLEKNPDMGYELNLDVEGFSKEQIKETLKQQIDQNSDFGSKLEEVMESAKPGSALDQVDAAAPGATVSQEANLLTQSRTIPKVSNQDILRLTKQLFDKKSDVYQQRSLEGALSPGEDLKLKGSDAQKILFIIRSHFVSANDLADALNGKDNYLDSEGFKRALLNAGISEQAFRSFVKAPREEFVSLMREVESRRAVFEKVMAENPRINYFKKAYQEQLVEKILGKEEAEKYWQYREKMPSMEPNYTIDDSGDAYAGVKYEKLVGWYSRLSPDELKELTPEAKTFFDQAKLKIRSKTMAHLDAVRSDMSEGKALNYALARQAIGDYNELYDYTNGKPDLPAKDQELLEQAWKVADKQKDAEIKRYQSLLNQNFDDEDDFEAQLRRTRSSIEGMQLALQHTPYAFDVKNIPDVDEMIRLKKLYQSLSRVKELSSEIDEAKQNNNAAERSGKGVSATRKRLADLRQQQTQADFEVLKQYRDLSKSAQRDLEPEVLPELDKTEKRISDSYRDNLKSYGDAGKSLRKYTDLYNQLIRAQEVLDLPEKSEILKPKVQMRYNEILNNIKLLLEKRGLSESAKLKVDREVLKKYSDIQKISSRPADYTVLDSELRKQITPAAKNIAEHLDNNVKAYYQAHDDLSRAKWWHIRSKWKLNGKLKDLYPSIMNDRQLLEKAGFWDYLAKAPPLSLSELSALGKLKASVSASMKEDGIVYTSASLSLYLDRLSDTRRDLETHPGDVIVTDRDGSKFVFKKENRAELLEEVKKQLQNARDFKRILSNIKKSLVNKASVAETAKTTETKILPQEPHSNSASIQALEDQHLVDNFWGNNSDNPDPAQLD